MTALHYAAKSGSEATSELLLAREPDINATDNSGMTALHYAAESGSEATSELLLAREPDINATDNSGMTALHYAAKSGSEATSELLLAREPDINATDNSGKTALHYAAQKRHKATVDLLVTKGSDVNATDDDGESALDIALKNGDLEVAEKIDSDKHKLFLYCIEKKYFNSIKAFSSKTEDVRDQKNNSLLLTVSRLGKTRLVNNLLKSGKDVSAVNDDGDSALHLAAENGHIRVTNHLLKYGASLQCKNNKGFTPEVSAKLKKRNKLSQYLAKVRHEKENEGQDDSYYDVQTPMTIPPMTPGTEELLLEDDDVADLVESYNPDTDDDSSQPSSSGYFSLPDIAEPTHTPLSTSTIAITRSSVYTQNNFAIPTHPAPRPGQAILPTLAQGNSNDDSASEIEQLKLQLAAERREKEAERREKEAEKRKNEAIIADKKQKDQAIADKKRKLSDQEQVITAKDEVINTKEQVIADKKQKLLEKQLIIEDKDLKLSQREQVIADKDQKLSQNEQVIAEKGKKLKKKDQRLKSIGKLLYECDDEPDDKLSDDVSGEKSDEESSVFHNEYHRDSRMQGLFAHKADYKLTKKDFENVLQLMGYVCAVYYHLPVGTYNGTGLFLGFVEPQVQGSTVSINPSSVSPGVSNTTPQVVVPSQPSTSTTLSTFTQFTGLPVITGPVGVILISGHNLEKWNPNVQPGELIFDWYERFGNVMKSSSSGLIAADKTLDYALLFTSDSNVISRFQNVPQPRHMVTTSIPPNMPPNILLPETTMTLIGHPNDSHMQGDHVEIIDKQILLTDKDFKCAISAAKFGAKKGANLHVVEEDFSIIYNCTSFHGASGAPCFRLVDGNVELVCIHGGGIFLNTTNPTLQDKSNFEFGNLMSYILSDINMEIANIGFTVDKLN